MSMLVWGGSAWLWGHGASRTGCMGEQDHQPPHCSGGYPGRGFGPCPVQLCWGQGEGPQASCIHRHIPIMSYPIAYGQHPQPCAQPGEPCTLLPASLPARIPPCPHPSLPISLPACILPCLHPSLPTSLPARIPPCPPGGLWCAQHCPVPCKQQHGHCRAPHLFCSGDSSAYPQAAGKDAGCAGAWTWDVSAHGFGTCQGTAAG